jgi:hypothetical protein
MLKQRAWYSSVYSLRLVSSDSKQPLSFWPHMQVSAQPRIQTTVRLIKIVRHLRSADHIIALGQKGNVIEQGTFAELDSTDGYLKSLAIAEAKKEGGKSTHREEENSNSRAVTAPSHATTTDDDVRRLGDFSVYNYYRKVLTLWRLLLFVVLEGISVPSYRFIREYLHHTILPMLTSMKSFLSSGGASRRAATPIYS